MYQRKRLGDAAVPKVLYTEARQRVDEHLHGGGTREDLTPMASQLALDNNLTEDQTDTLLNEIMLKHFDRLNHHNVIEHELLSNPSQLNKSIFYLWHQLSRRYGVGEPIYMSTNQGVAMARVSKSDYSDLIKTMRKMKILKRLGKGQQGANSNCLLPTSSWLRSASIKVRDTVAVFPRFNSHYLYHVISQHFKVVHSIYTLA